VPTILTSTSAEDGQPEQFSEGQTRQLPRMGGGEHGASKGACHMDNYESLNLYAVDLR
jgi:hypothetical protein